MYRFFDGPVDAEGGPEARLDAWPIDDCAPRHRRCARAPWRGALRDDGRVVVRVSKHQHLLHDGGALPKDDRAALIAFLSAL